MKNPRSRLSLPRLIACAVLAAAAAPSAWAVPSYARQTGMACSTCHTVFPELTPFGREFKLNGYVLDNMKQIKGITMERSESLSLNSIPPLSAMAMISYNHTSKAVPDSVVSGANAQAGDVLFPDQASLFYAGKIADGMGAFIQLTYDGVAGSFGLDNTDIRYAQHLPLQMGNDRELIWGLTLNNNPTVQDAWNTTPAWGFPFVGSPTAPGPVASQIDGGLGGAVAGLGGYVWFDHSLYAEFSLYTGAHQGGLHPVDSSQSPIVHGIAPYWRLAYESRWDRNSLTVGTYGMRSSIVPAGVPVSAGATDRFTDYAIDAQYQYISDDHLISAFGNFIHENQQLDASFAGGASANSSDSLNTEKLAVQYYFRRKVGGALGFFNTSGSTDSVLYAPGTAVDGFANNSPSSRGYVVEANYLPFLNVKLQLQYVWYTKFNGGGGNYDGVGRNASDNNTLYVLGWFNF